MTKQPLSQEIYSHIVSGAEQVDKESHSFRVSQGLRSPSDFNRVLTIDHFTILMCMYHIILQEKLRKIQSWHLNGDCLLMKLLSML